MLQERLRDPGVAVDLAVRSGRIQQVEIPQVGGRPARLDELRLDLMVGLDPVARTSVVRGRGPEGQSSSPTRALSSEDFPEFTSPMAAIRMGRWRTGAGWSGSSSKATSRARSPIHASSSDRRSRTAKYLSPGVLTVG
jgi:hypothetical protein